MQLSNNDHRAIGSRLQLFHQQEEGPGMVFWHPRGYALYHLIENVIRRHMRAAGFREIKTPQVLARSLWEASGHWEKFAEQMFSFGDGERQYALKPMSCPGHIQVFNKGVRSYRDLPLRFCEFGACHRNEPSGALQGLMRTRSFVQDDAHIFCRPDQVEAEVARFARMLTAIYAEFGFPSVAVALATRPPRRAGTDEMWEQAETMLGKAASAAGIDYALQPGEGAFYGPKLEFILQDMRGREWQCGTIQLDFVLPERLDARYADQFGGQARPIMLHQAVLGSLERFIAMLLEQHGGRLPFWLAPEQVYVTAIATDGVAAAQGFAALAENAGLRVTLELGSERLARKVVAARELEIPVMAMFGAHEAADGTVSLRWLDGRRALLPVGRAIEQLGEAAKSPSRQGLGAA